MNDNETAQAIQTALGDLATEVRYHWPRDTITVTTSSGQTIWVPATAARRDPDGTTKYIISETAINATPAHRHVLPQRANPTPPHPTINT